MDRSVMKTNIVSAFLSSAIVGLLLCVPASADEKLALPTFGPLVEAAQKDLNLVGIGGILQFDGKTVATTVAGQRKQGDDKALSLIHI